jgi:hypothetical protein
MKLKQNHLIRAIAALAVAGCMLTGCGKSASTVPGVPSDNTSYEVSEEENSITASDNSWKIEVEYGSDSTEISKSYTAALENLDSASIETYTILSDAMTTYSDGNKLFERVIAVSEEALAQENSIESLFVSSLPEKDGTFYAILGFEYDANDVLLRSWVSSTDEATKYNYTITNGEWEYDSFETDNEFLNKFSPLFATLHEDLESFLKEQEPVLKKIVDDAAQLVEKELPYVPNGSCGENVTWKLKDGVLILSGSGSTNSYHRKKAPWYDYHDEITAVKVESGVTHIGDCAFYGFNNLTDVEIADTVTSIGSGVFSDCTALTSFVFAENMEIPMLSFGVFDGCTALTEVTLPSTITYVPNDFFLDCSALTDIYFGGSKDEWAAVEVDDIGNDLSNVTIHCAK